jgi:hypothetical protein
MSADKIKVRELIEQLSKQDQEAYVVVYNYEDDWLNEGMVDGPGSMFEVAGHEIRSGWIPAEDNEFSEKLLMLSATVSSEEELKEIFNDRKCECKARREALKKTTDFVREAHKEKLERIEKACCKKRAKLYAE